MKAIPDSYARARRMIYNVGGCLSVGLAFAGLFLPLLPTTPFVLLSAFCFSRGSARLHAWLLGHPTMGPIIRDWNESRVVRRRTKVLATIYLLLVMSPALIFGSFPAVLKGLSAAVGLLVVVMIWRQASAGANPGTQEPGNPEPESASAT